MHYYRNSTLVLDKGQGYITLNVHINTQSVILIVESI